LQGGRQQNIPQYPLQLLLLLLILVIRLTFIIEQY
jgi:hypothetical protein